VERGGGFWEWGKEEEAEIKADENKEASEGGTSSSTENKLGTGVGEEIEDNKEEEGWYW